MEESKERKYYSDLQVEGDLYFPSHAPDLTHFYVLLFQKHRWSPDPRPWGPEGTELPDPKAHSPSERQFGNG